MLVPRRATLVAMLLTLVAAMPQQAVPPPPPATDGPTLEVTMKFIQSKIEDIGDLRGCYNDNRYPEQECNPVLHNRYIEVVADPKACTVEMTQSHEGFDFVTTVKMHLGDLSKVAIRSDNDPPNTQLHYDPNFQELGIYFSSSSVDLHVVSTVPDPLRQVDKKHPAQMIKKVSDHKSKRVDIAFGDQDVADRVAKALTHAAELCGGGNRDPF